MRRSEQELTWLSSRRVATSTACHGWRRRESRGSGTRLFRNRRMNSGGPMTVQQKDSRTCYEAACAAFFVSEANLALSRRQFVTPLPGAA